MTVELEHVKLIHETFRMFGNPENDYWFLGLEESTDPKISADQQVMHQHKASLALIENGTEPLHDARGRKEYQRTWGGYIKLLLSIKSNMYPSTPNWNVEVVKEYQRSTLGALNKEEFGSCLMELYPLPRKTRAHAWIYKELAHRQGLEFLSTPSKYKKHPLVEGRVELLLDKVKDYNPRVLFCFGSDCRYSIEQQLHSPLEALRVEKGNGKKPLPVYTSSVDSTLLVFSHHPVAPGVTDEYWRNLGAIVARMLSDEQRLNKAA